ncbi:polysaccharide deacetylase family protein [Streptomyces sp. NBC_00102]|uniref:polysaccharide deacetylase family protein n=1 Tax=Streptomyces sp. NBC_00102 TaxID=2975652 RepID=UPI002255D0DC|nr:polysaccharide deacetylase family protein [Streptomyces sp. NBC_00102]MCX5398427.1 polysaccharide deacetylase family protein [Streptomyces sp. NBC_00102]
MNDTSVTPGNRTDGLLSAAELLGHPPGARLLIVNCDDFGMYSAINEAVVEAIEQGIAGSCSLMVPCPAAPDAMRRLSRRPEIPFGVHLTMVCEMPGNPWGPMAGKEKAPSLLDPAGRLFAPTPEGRAALLAQARIEDVEREFRAQIDTVAAAGLTPTHLDFHCLADGGRDDIFDLTVSLAGEYGLAVRAWLAPARAAMRRRRLPVSENDFLDSYSLPLDGKPARYAQLLRELPPGLNEWAIHPSLGTLESRALDDGWRVRRTDYEFLVSAEAREVLAEEDIRVVDYAEVRRVWRERNHADYWGS